MSQFSTDIAAVIRDGQTKPVRTIRQFAVDEVRIPPGSKHAGERLQIRRQPVQGIFFDEVDRGYWLDIVCTAPSQAAKTFLCFDIPLAYHVAELQETVVVGVPDGQMVDDKWNQEIRPIFDASPKLRELLPITGEGSRGGKVRDVVTFRNGASMRFMTRAGSNQSKAGYTARVVVVTEASGWTAGTENSEEADPLRQLRARQKSWDREERTLIIEGTGTVEEDYPWALHKISTKSRLVTMCPHCGEWNQPERRNLRGWDAADSEDEAASLAYFECPDCGDTIDDEMRREAVEAVRIVHDGQWIDRHGDVCGDLPVSRRLWFRWSGWHNLFSSIGSLAAEEWKKTQEIADSPAEESAERELCQFIWAVPYEMQLGDDIRIDATVTAKRKADLYAHEILPEDTTHLAMGIDIGMRKGHYVVLAGRECGRIHLPAYGEFDIDGDKMDTDLAIQMALEKFWHEFASAGMMFHGSRGEAMVPTSVMVDANYKTKGVFAAWASITKRARSHPLLPVFGRGSSQMIKAYSHPKRRGSGVMMIGDEWHLSRYRNEDGVRGFCGFINVDHWKDQFHHHISVPIESVGSLTLYAAPARDHLKITQHWAGEVRTEEFKPGRGKKVVWDRKIRQQHWFDASIYARVGLSRIGWKVPEVAAKT